MGNFKETFEAYGADYALTMERFMGNEAMYLRLLDMLFKDDNLQKLSAALEQGDLAAAFAAAHTLKGVVGNMGLTPLYDAICIILEPLRIKEAREDYPQLLQAVQIEFQKAEQLQARLKGGEPQ